MNNWHGETDIWNTGWINGLNTIGVTFGRLWPVTIGIFVARYRFGVYFLPWSPVIDIGIWAPENVVTLAVSATIGSSSNNINSHLESIVIIRQHFGKQVWHFTRIHDISKIDACSCRPGISSKVVGKFGICAVPVNHCIKSTAIESKIWNINCWPTVWVGVKWIARIEYFTGSIYKVEPYRTRC